MQNLDFKLWLKEMVGTGAIYDPKVKPVDFQWWGAPESMGKPVKKKNKKK
jgi:hypothetical protein